MNVTLLNDWIEKNAPHGALKLAGLAETSLTNLQKIRKGQNRSPGINVCKRLAAAIGVPLAKLCEDPAEGATPPEAA